MATNVFASDLNYDVYEMARYDRDIARSIPGHGELHALLQESVVERFPADAICLVLDLGTGTAITSRAVRDILPKAEFDLVDFSSQMLEGAKRRMGEGCRYLLGDYAEMMFEPTRYDIVLSVIGIHHQDTAGKKRVFKKTYEALRPGGIFLFGDVVTYRDKRRAALNTARHYAHLVAQSADETALEEWAHHHMFLNDPATIEDQVEWLEEIGFATQVLLLRLNTALVLCRK